MNVLNALRRRAQQAKKTIVLPEASDERVRQAADTVIREGLARLILLGRRDEILETASAEGLDLAQAEIIDPIADPAFEEYATRFFEARKHKGVSEEDARALMAQTVYFGAMMVATERADGFVAGAVTTTAEVAKAAIYCIGFGGRVGTISSSFLVSVPDSEYGEHGVFVFADCGIVPQPSPSQLANIAGAAAELFRLLVEVEPRVALLSFSSKGSAEHEAVAKVIRAKQIIEERFPDLVVDGELQLDAAIVPEVAAIKAPDSQVAGKANVLIFPDLNAGNISYKLVQRLAKADVIGPMMLGLRKPCSDLSRGCTREEVVNAVCTTAIRVIA